MRIFDPNILPEILTHLATIIPWVILLVIVGLPLILVFLNYSWKTESNSNNNKAMESILTGGILGQYVLIILLIFCFIVVIFLVVNTSYIDAMISTVITGIFVVLVNYFLRH